jgi:hypothetical protein
VNSDLPTTPGYGPEVDFSTTNINAWLHSHIYAQGVHVHG